MCDNEQYIRMLTFTISAAADYKSGKDSIAAEYKSAMKACGSMSGKPASRENAMGLCI